MNRELTPRELADRISPILAILSGLATFALLNALDAMHLWALAILAGLLTETVSSIIIAWAVNKFIYRKMKDLSEVISQVNDNVQSEDAASLNDILMWANEQIANIKSLRQKDSFRKEFIGNLAHELKTPLFNVQGFILTLLEGDLKDEEWVRRFLSKANKNVERMTELIEDLDAISKLESDSLEMVLAPCNIVDVLNDAIESAENKAQNHDIKLELIIPAEHLNGLNVLCGPPQIQQVLTNLLINSIHYGKPGGRSSLRLSNHGEYVTIDIEDNGIGISQEDLPRIYERFYRVDKSRSRHAGGSGLGLAIVKHIIEAHGQSIHVESKLNEGTTFSFNLVNLDFAAQKRNVSLPAQ